MSSKLAKYTALVLFNLILFFFLLEVVSRLYLAFRPSVSYVSRWEYRKNNPPAYQGAEFYNKTFLLDSMQCGTSRPWEPGKNFRQMNDYRGKYINFIDGQRYTTDQPDHYQNRVLLFGGSTLFSQEVPDKYTIASYLQRLLNAQNLPLTVENYAVPSIIAQQQLNKLRTVNINTGDIVIFYDGVNDIVAPLYNGDISGLRLDSPNDGGGFQPLSTYQKWIHIAFIKFGDYSGAVRLAFNPKGWRLPANIVDKQKFEQNLEKMQKGYLDALIEAQSYTSEHGGIFLHFLQPNIFTLSNKSEHKRWLMENDLKSSPGLDIAFDLGYPKLKEAIVLAKTKNIISYDLTKALDNATTEVYLDLLHINHVGNKLIAQYVYENLISESPRAIATRQLQAPNTLKKNIDLKEIKPVLQEEKEPPVMAEEGYKGYNIVKYAGRYYGISQAEGPIDITQIKDKARYPWFTDDSIEGVESKIGDHTHPSLLNRILKKTKSLF